MFVVTTSGVAVRAPFAGLDPVDVLCHVGVVAFKMEQLAQFYDMLNEDAQRACEKVYANRLMAHGSL